MPDPSPRTLALFGGTFDPVHLGHLRVAWEAAEFLDAEVRMMPANVPHALSAVTRFKMLLTMLKA